MRNIYDFDVIVIGAGHAGCEAALASAGLGHKTLVFCLSLDTIANMPCNPCIGGSAKGQIVCEIDALGGEMARAADATMLQSRMLNRGKGAAVHSLRVQSDRTAYHLYMKKALEQKENLYIKQGEVVEILTKNGKAAGVVTRIGTKYSAKSVVITTGTYLGGRIHIGELNYESGPDGVMPSNALVKSLEKLGIALKRFKTGTPARVHRRSVDFSKMEEQCGDDEIIPFSFGNNLKLQNRTKCFVTYTNAETHRIITENLHRSPLYGGRIKGVGPRYCPSIEDKVVRFKDRERHQIFVEPMGEDTDEYYIQGMSSSLPEEVQIMFMRTIKGLENVEIMRPAYAIEYDCCDTTELYPTLEFKKIEGLFGAGQFNCTSGYEEAAAQGLVAGINAARRAEGAKPIVLERSNSYIGTLIDDIVTKGCNEPYRMMTSRSEYRLFLRQDNAPERLTEIGHQLGLISNERYEFFRRTSAAVENEIKRLTKLTLPATEQLNEMLITRGTSPISQPTRAIELLKRPQVSYADISGFDESAPGLSSAIILKIETAVKYEGYIKTQKAQIEKATKLEKKLLPREMDYSEIKGLRVEAMEKLNKMKPLSVGQAARISGVNPADITVLLIWLAANKNGTETSDEL